ncbi:MAG: MobA/MobL family protein [Rhodanobacter sp.]
MQHARPHLQTHGRSQGHSAVAGAAYRLGLRLYDERTKTWHDYRKRKLGEEIVAALTLAPQGAPDWATDPERLWNRVEAAELRKDSQVARDYRIPVPFGLTDVTATELARQMAQFIVDELQTSVSMGLHRDADVDALGAVKPKDKQGYHAHLYFPTRKVEEVDDGEGSRTWGLKTKFAFLTGRRSSSDFVERLNERWAELANEFTAADALPADYTHLSYARQGLAIEPQPKLGQAVVAMERRGFFTRKGNALRDIVLPSIAYENVHAADVVDQREQAVIDVVREAARQAVTVDVGAANSNDPSVRVPIVGVSDETPGPAVIAAGDVGAVDVPAGWAPAPHRLLPVPEHASLMARFEAALPIVPVTPEARETFFSLLKFVQAIERALRALSSLAGKLLRHEEDTGRRVTAKLDTDYELDSARRARAAAEQQLRQWEVDHPWRMLKSRALNAGPGVDHPKWQALNQEVQRWDRHVQELKAAIQSHRNSLDDLSEQEVALKTLRARSKEQLAKAVGGLVELGPTLGTTLLAVIPESQRGWLKEALPDRATDTSSDERLLDPPPEKMVARLRPTPRP